jgi:hypothetical protein
VAHTAHGTLVGIAGNDGLINPAGSLLLDGVTTVAIVPIRRTGPDGTEVEATPPVVAVELSGRVNHSDDTVSAVYLADIPAAGALLNEVADAILRAAGPDALDEAVSAMTRHVVDAHRARHPEQAPPSRAARRAARHGRRA